MIMFFMVFLFFRRCMYILPTYLYGCSVYIHVCPVSSIVNRNVEAGACHSFYKNATAFLRTSMNNAHIALLRKYLLL
jgi:hypothetical protein